MVSMKMSKETKNSDLEDVKEGETNEYPYGLIISLNDEIIEKLGIKELPKVGDIINLNALVSVKSVSEREGESDNENETERMLSLQITDMELAPQKKGKTNAEIFYGDKD